MNTFKTGSAVSDIFYSVCFYVCVSDSNEFPGALLSHYRQQQLRMALLQLEFSQAWGEHYLAVSQQHADDLLTAVWSFQCN